MSKTANPNIRKIEKMQVEKVVSGMVHMKLPYFRCVKCHNTNIRRTVSAYTNKSYKSKPNPRFNCRTCQYTTKFVWSEKHEEVLDFEEYKEILKEEI